jgi:hypothetical protein
MDITRHAAEQCTSRSIPVAAIQQVIETKLSTGWNGADAAVYVGRTNDRGSLMTSNGDQVWAIIRDGRIHTVMLRRSDQPSTPQALRVSKVYGPSVAHR